MGGSAFGGGRGGAAALAFCCALALSGCAERAATVDIETASAAYAEAPAPPPSTEDALRRVGIEPTSAAADPTLRGVVIETEVEGFAFGLPGDLTPGSGAGVWDTLVHAPGIRFPLETAPAYINTQVWGHGGLSGPKGSQCDPANYRYPWRDNFCEARDRATSHCPGGAGQHGVDIRPATCADDLHWAVAVEDGEIRKVGTFSVVLRGVSGLDFHYLHLSRESVTVRRGDRVRAGERIGLVSDDFGGTPTTVHLHFEIRREIETPRGRQSTPLSPYLSLVEAYLRQLPGDHPKTVAELLGAPAASDAIKDCPACPVLAAIEIAAARPIDGEPMPSARFAIGVTEVTFAQWDACAAEGYCHPIYEDGGAGRGAAPVVGVSRWDIVGRPDIAPEARQGGDRGFVAWLNSKVEGAPYRLPSDAEWTFAARGGLAGASGFGAPPTPEQANFDGRFLTDYAAAIRFRRGPVAAGSLPANGYGLHEMHGNVWEWTAACADGAGEALGEGERAAPDAARAAAAAEDPEFCRLGVRRGGSLESPPEDMHVRLRAVTPPGRGARDLGFRIAKTIDPTPPVAVRLVRPNAETAADQSAALEAAPSGAAAAAARSASR